VKRGNEDENQDELQGGETGRQSQRDNVALYAEEPEGQDRGTGRGCQALGPHGLSEREETKMRTKTNCKAGRIAANHSETMVRDTRKNLKVRTAVRAGAIKR